MQVLLTGKKRLPGFVGAWREVAIDDLFTRTRRYVQWSDQDMYRLVSVRRRFGGLFARGEYFGSQIEVKKVKSIHAGDFLISKRQVSHGAWGVVPDEFHDWKVSDEYDCLKVKDERKLNPAFWGWFCKSPRLRHGAFLSSIGIHIEKLIFDYDTFKKKRVRIPASLEEQVAITKLLDLVEREIVLLGLEVEKAREQKKGLMGELLMGRRRITATS